VWRNGGFLAANFALVPGSFPCILPYMDTTPLTLIRPTDAAPKRVQKRSHRPTKLQLPSMASLDQRTNAAREFSRLASAIEQDLGGRSELSNIELSLVQAFCGASVALAALNMRLVRDGEEGIDLGVHALICGALCRISSRLGLQRRPRDVTGPSLGDLMRRDQARQLGE
jgi:hypothetical protein